MTDFAASSSSQPRSALRRCAIFCKVVDNLGDIGVCWRLARQLADEFSLCIDLWVDDIALAQTFAGTGHLRIQLWHWQADRETDCLQDYLTQTPLPQAVIETFGCGLPAAVQQALLSQPCCWINLDYLSAEAWVADFHGRPSPQANGLVRHFFYPGFDAHTGGLLREKTMPRTDHAARSALEGLGLTEASELVTVSLFCYAQAPLHAFWHSLLASPQPVRLLVPQMVMPGLAAATGLPTLTAGQRYQQDHLSVQVLPFVSQPLYDQVLALCDFNIVRGEDSWLRALWAAKPMLWQPYIQSEDTHVLKLRAFLQHYLAQAEGSVARLLEHTMLAWTQGHWQPADWQGLVHHLPALKAHAQAYATRQSQQADLATKLVIFIENWWAHQV